MNIIFDFETEDGTVYKGCKFIHYLRNIRGGRNNIILSQASDSIRIFDNEDNEIKDIGISNIYITKAFDVDDNVDITTNLQYLKSFSSILEERYID